VEASSGYSLSHGESVAIGMAAATRLSGRLHGLPASDAARIAAVIRAVGLPDRLPAGMEPEEIRLRLALDKKREGGATHYVLLKKMGMPFINGSVPEGILRETLEEMRS
jgi:3-dehydroquinate synthase